MAEDWENHPGSSWKGKAIEQLIAAKCVLASGGRLNVSTPFVDDAGVDLIFNLRDRPATLAVQVKARFRSASMKRNTFMTQVRRATFQPRPDLALLFVLYDDIQLQDLELAWLVPAEEFSTLTRAQHEGKARLVFATSLTGSGGMWAPFRHMAADLAGAIVHLLESLNRQPVT
jgi:hypothetical protein